MPTGKKLYRIYPQKKPSYPQNFFAFYPIELCAESTSDQGLGAEEAPNYKVLHVFLGKRYVFLHSLGVIPSERSREAKRSRGIYV